MSVLQQPGAVSPDFADQVGDILALLAGTFEVDGVDAHAVPGEGGDRSQQARVALEEARAALKKGDEGACAGAVSRAKAQLDAAP